MEVKTEIRFTRLTHILGYVLIGFILNSLGVVLFSFECWALIFAISFIDVNSRERVYLDIMSDFEDELERLLTGKDDEDEEND